MLDVNAYVNNIDVKDVLDSFKNTFRTESVKYAISEPQRG